MNLQELKIKDPEELLKQADKLEIENPFFIKKTRFNVCYFKKNSF